MKAVCWGCDGHGVGRVIADFPNRRLVGLPCEVCGGSGFTLNDEVPMAGRFDRLKNRQAGGVD